jgi:outer membrane protein TolC
MSRLLRCPLARARLRLLQGVVFWLVCLAAAPVQAQPPLTLDDALRAAQARSRQLSAQDAAALAAREMAVAAGRRPDPVIKGSLTNLPIDGPDRFSITRDFMTMRSIGVMQEFTREDKRVARSARFQREAELAQAGRVEALADLQRDTAIAWLELHYRGRMLELMGTQRAEAQLQVDAADAAYRGGRSSQSDAIAARSAVAAIDDRLRMTERDIATARTRLGRWVGDPAGRETGALPAGLDRPPLRLEDLDAVLENHPRIASLARQLSLAQAEVDVAQSDKKSDWSAELMFSQRGPAYSNMVSLGVSIPWQWDAANRQDREASAKAALVQRVRDEREEALREVVASTRSALQAWQANRERLAQYDVTLIPLAAERVRAAQAAYRGASGPLGAVLEARRAALDTRLEHLRIEMETAGLWAQLNYLIPAQSPASSAKEP